MKENISSKSVPPSHGHFGKIFFAIMTIAHAMKTDLGLGFLGFSWFLEFLRVSRVVRVFRVILYATFE